MQLLHKALPLARAFAGRLPTTQEMKFLTQEHGVSLATAVWIKCLQETAPHAEFSREVRTFDLTKNAADLRAVASKFEVVVVASSLPAGRRAWGEHVEEWRAWARELGFSTEVILTDPGFGIDFNARVIAEALLAEPHPNRILVTYGQGTSEVRFLLEKRLRERSAAESGELAEGRRAGGVEFAGVRAWISVAGAFAGASSSSLMLKGVWRPLAAKIRMFMAGRAPRVLRDTASESWRFKSDMPVPNDMLVVSVVGVPYASQIPAGLTASYLELGKIGPNDGVVLCTEAVVQPSVVVPIAGMSHNGEPRLLKPVLQRLFATSAMMFASLETK